MFEPTIAMAATAAGGGAVPQTQGGGIENFMPLILIFVVFYFLLIRPQQKKMKIHQKMLNELKRGDKVVSSGGMHGTIVALKGGVIEVEIANGVKVTFSKSSISTIVQPGQEVVDNKPTK